MNFIWFLKDRANLINKPATFNALSAILVLLICNGLTRIHSLRILARIYKGKWTNTSINYTSTVAFFHVLVRTKKVAFFQLSLVKYLTHGKDSTGFHVFVAQYLKRIRRDLKVSVRTRAWKKLNSRKQLKLQILYCIQKPNNENQENI